MAKSFFLTYVFLIGIGVSAHAEIRKVVVHTIPNLYLNTEKGFGAADTKVMPAKLELLCDDPQSNEVPLRICGALDVSLRVFSYGATAFFLDYTRKNPLLISLHVNPQEALVADVLGSYIGARVGGGLAVGGRGMLLVNTSSGVFASSSQGMSPLSWSGHNSGFNFGIDVSVPIMEIQYQGNVELNSPLSSLNI